MNPCDAEAASMLWLSEDAISQWYEPERVYIGTGAPKRYSDFAIRTCHEVRLVYRLPVTARVYKHIGPQSAHFFGPN